MPEYIGPSSVEGKSYQLTANTDEIFTEESCFMVLDEYYSGHGYAPVIFWSGG